jgi:hypothetical protein
MVSWAIRELAMMGSGSLLAAVQRAGGEDTALMNLAAQRAGNQGLR